MVQGHCRSRRTCQRCIYAVLLHTLLKVVYQNQHICILDKGYGKKDQKGDGAQSHSRPLNMASLVIADKVHAPLKKYGPILWYRSCPAVSKYFEPGRGGEGRGGYYTAILPSPLLSQCHLYDALPILTLKHFRMLKVSRCLVKFWAKTTDKRCFANLPRLMRK